MKIEDIIDKMSKSYLERIVKSFTNEIYSKDEEGYKKQILSNIDFLEDSEKIHERLKKQLSQNKNPYLNSLLISFILRVLLGSNQYQATQEEVYEKIKKLEEDIIAKSKSKENFKHIDDQALDIFKTILEVAFEDDTITDDELRLINKIRKKLAIQENDQYLIQALLNQFPQKNNAVHDLNQINMGLTDLQRCGVLFYCNKLPGQPYVLPDEMVEGVKEYLSIELMEDKFKSLLDILNIVELRKILENLKLLQNGTKEVLIDRIIIAGTKPSEALSGLSVGRLTELCKKLPDVKSSGNKEEKIKRIISYFDELINIDVESMKDEREKYYTFFEQLAKKDMPNLIGKKIIKHERDAELAFEKATTYIFEKKLNQKIVKQVGVEHCDGCMEFSNSRELFMWDNKCKMTEKYKFPNSHLNQFKRYIRDASNRGSRVSCFLIVVPDFEDVASNNAERLKYESGQDTDVAIIAAATLKWVAEEWAKNYEGKVFNLQILNKTGLLTKEELKRRIKLFGG